MVGFLFCLHNVVMQVRKGLNVRRMGGLPQVRGFSYRYVAWVQGHHALLRYHNIHLNDDDYHHRVLNWRTGEEVLYETLERHQFPTLSEVLDEVQAVYQAFKIADGRLSSRVSKLPCHNPIELRSLCFL